MKKVATSLRVKDLSVEDKIVLDKMIAAEQSSKTADGGCHLARQVEHDYSLRMQDELTQRYYRLIRQGWIVNGARERQTPHYEVSDVYVKTLQTAR